VFSLYVVKTERGRKILLSPNGKPLQKEGSVYWNQASSGATRSPSSSATT
jgi:hypothetical protein